MLTINPGIKDGTIIKFNAYTDEDIHIKIKVLPDNKYIIDGLDIYSYYDIDLFTAILGGYIDIELPDNLKLKIKIPEGTQNNKVFRITNKGLHSYSDSSNDKRGNFYVKVNVKIPINLTDKERNLFLKLKNINTNG
jgi:curved DNA-binding protein